MDNTLKQSIQEDMKTAMRAKDSKRLGVIRMLMAAIKQREVDERIVLDDNQILAVIDKMIRQRRDSYEQFTAAKRIDLAEQEKFEIEVLQNYLPQQLTAAEIDAIIAAAVSETKAAAISDMGKVMAIVKPKVQGRADMAQISAKIKELLTTK
jgi:uncharacterized protein YqeY